MPLRSPRRLRLLVALTVLAGCAAGGPAAAAGSPGFAGTAGTVAAALLIAIALQFLIALLLPRFTRRLQRALHTGLWPAAGWGALAAVLTAVVAAVLSQGGEAGKAVAGVGGAAVGLLSIAGSIGIAKIIGDWALVRWGTPDLGPLNVLCGGLVWCLAGAVPIVGWGAALFSLLAGLGAAVQVVLQPRDFDPVPPPPPPLMPDESDLLETRDPP